MQTEQSLTLTKLQRRLLFSAAFSLGAYALALSLAPFVRMQSWSAELRWQHWIGYLAWLALFSVVQRASVRRLPGADPYLLPIAALFSGWGLLTIFRLFPAFGLRQTAWLAVGAAILIAGVWLPSRLSFLRRYKYVWLTSGLLLTALTLVLGTNPLGYGPRMWLGCCGIYLQPSEPLKLLLIVYLAAYLADRQPIPEVARQDRSLQPLLPFLAPTLIMTGIALLLLAVQRDLGTATIFVFLYTTIVYLSTGRKQILVVGTLLMLLAALIGVVLFDVVRVRFMAWFNPWQDPSGDSYQIVQSLIAVANGGILGRGPGIGSPGLVPVPHSDFIYAAIVEESGLAGGLALLLLIGLLSQRGLSIALHATSNFRRLLAAGLTAFLAAQSILIIGGNLRLLPLTGVTLPFVSYGGSSLVTTFISLLLLLHISNVGEERPAVLADSRPYRHLQALLLTGVACAALITGWWSVYRAPVLLGRTDNLRLGIADRYVRRGALLDRENRPINQTEGTTGELSRTTVYPPLSNVIGYTHPVYGQSGLEATLDPVLRGLQFYPATTVWWNRLLYGMPPPGRDIRLSLDLDIQQFADQALGNHHGALVFINPSNGEILALASHPTFNANDLDETWSTLIQGDNAPLVNRTIQGRYPAGGTLGPLLWMKAQELGLTPGLLAVQVEEEEISNLVCAFPVEANGWPEWIAAGCPEAQTTLAAALDGQVLAEFLGALGLTEQPQIDPFTPASSITGGTESLAVTPDIEDFMVSPLQIALAAASISSGGTRPAAHLVLGVNTEPNGWQAISAPDQAQRVSTPQAAEQTAGALQDGSLPIWSALSLLRSPANDPDKTGLTWFLGGSLPEASINPVVLVFVLEEENPQLAQEIGTSLLEQVLEHRPGFSGN